MTEEHVSGAAISEHDQPVGRSPIPSDYERLRRLYEIQAGLARSTGIAQACATTLSIVTQALTVRTAILLDATRDVHLAFAWAAEGVAPAVLEGAQEHARTALAYLAPAIAASAPVDRRSEVLRGGVDSGTNDRHFVTLPLSLATGEVFGVFQLQGARQFEERDLLFIDAMVDHLAIALGRHHTEAAHAVLEATNRQLGNLQLISNAALRGTTLDDSLTAILDALGALFATHVAAVLLTNPDGKTLLRWTSIGLDQRPAGGIPIGVGAVRRLASVGSAIVFEDPEKLEDLGPTLVANGVRSLAGAPLHARNRVTGAVYVGSRDRERFTREDVALLGVVAERIEKIVDHAMLYEAALAAIRSRDAVLATVSHDLLNPLGTIQMWTELFISKDPNIVHGVEVIQNSVARMIRLIGDLLDFGSIEAGHLSIKRSPESAESLVREALEGVRSAAIRKSLRLPTRFPIKELVVECDRVRIVQVLTNLMTNAIKFTPEGGTITIALVAEGNCARFSVADTGCGIPASDLPRIFERYWQATATAHRGRGLGLAIAKGIIETHGGALSVESLVGRGTTFSFTLPLARDADGHPNTASGHLTHHSHVATDPSGPRVLVIDDEPNALSALAELLADEGFVVATAADGPRALSSVGAFAPDILVVDVDMPGLTGPELVRKIREMLGDIPAILMTGFDDHGIAAELDELHAAYIGKPVEIDALVSQIQLELAGHRRS